jgi:hypothetical protein
LWEFASIGHWQFRPRAAEARSAPLEVEPIFGQFQAHGRSPDSPTLTRKRDEIEATIKAYEKKIAAARRDLANVNATLRLFKLDGGRPNSPSMWIR